MPNGLYITRQYSGVQQVSSGGGGGAPTPDLLWWKFTNGSGTTVTATVGPDGTAIAPTWTTGSTGSNGAIQFNGTSSTVYSTAITYGSKVITVCGWIYWNAYTAGNAIGWESSTDATYGPFGPTFSFSPDTSSYTNSAVPDIFSTGGNIRQDFYTQPSAAAWHHWAIVYDNSTTAADIKVYIDGSLATAAHVGSSSTNGNVNFADQLVVLMSRGATSSFGAGKIADFRIYSYELNSTQVSAVYASPQ